MSVSASILERIGNTPMVRLDHVAAGLQVAVYGKCAFLNPGGSGKDRIALAIVEDAQRQGLLKPGLTLVEATAGNTGVGLALVAAVRATDSLGWRAEYATRAGDCRVITEPRE